MVIKMFNKNIDNTELAYELVCFDECGKYRKEVKRILKEFTPKGELYPDRQDIFLKVIDIIGEPKTPKERYIVAEAYLWSRYPFKLKGIEYGNLYLNNLLWEEILENNEDKNMHIFQFLQWIGKIYESEYKFEKALEYYNKEIKILPKFQVGYLDVSRILVKLDKKQEALDLLQEANKKKDVDDIFKKIIEEEVEEVKRKIEKKYKYKPRPSKCKFEKEYYNNLSELQKKYLQEYINQGLVIIE